MVLSQMTTLQRKNGVKLTTRDANGNQVSLSGLPVPQALQNNIVTFANVAAVLNTNPPNSQFTFDIIALGFPSVGPMTINLGTHLANGNQGFVQGDTTLVVVPDPSIPGPPDHFDVEDGINEATN